MLFTSLAFVTLVAATFVLYYSAGSARWQVGVLIAASLAFYAYGQPVLLALLLFSALVSAVCSHATLRAGERRNKVLWAVAGVSLNLALLGFFKYKGLAADLLSLDLAAAGGPAHWLLLLPLPIGISFYTFHGISLLVDVLRQGPLAQGDGTADERFGPHLGRTLLYLTFFPQLVAGPIAKAHFFFPQIGAKSIAQIDWRYVTKNLILGYFLKMVVADNLQQQTFWIVYPYFLNFPAANLAGFLFGYSMQIFADFAGYSLIALGLAALFGYRLPVNFDFPYISQSVTEFWRRWHLSLSSWLKDYLYIPLGGNRKGAARTYFNLLAVMFLGGLWHGAALSYAVWGTCHGLALALERVFRNASGPQSVAWPVQVLRVGLVFGFVTLAWLLFKLPDFSEVLAYLQAMAVTNRSMPAIDFYLLVIGLFSVPVVLYHAAYQWRVALAPFLARVSPVLHGVMLAAIILNSGPSSAFIYFQF